MHGSMGGGRKPLTVGYAVRQRAPLAYPTNPRGVNSQPAKGGQFLTGADMQKLLWT